MTMTALNRLCKSRRKGALLSSLALVPANVSEVHSLALKLTISSHNQHMSTNMVISSKQKALRPETYNETRFGVKKQ